MLITKIKSIDLNNISKLDIGDFYELILEEEYDPYIYSLIFENFYTRDEEDRIEIVNWIFESIDHSIKSVFDFMVANYDYIRSNSYCLFEKAVFDGNFTTIQILLDKGSRDDSGALLTKALNVYYGQEYREEKEYLVYKDEDKFIFQYKLKGKSKQFKDVVIELSKVQARYNPYVHDNILNIPKENNDEELSNTLSMNIQQEK